MNPPHHITLPLELVDEIVHASLETGPVNSRPGWNEKPPWTSVSSLSLACKSYRRLVLKAWFYRLYTGDPEDTTNCVNIPQVERSWVRQMHCVHVGGENSYDLIPWNLQGYSRLETVRLDSMSPSGRIFTQAPDNFPFINAPSTVVHFEFRGLYWPSPRAYNFIPRCFPHIKTLVLYQQNVWCGLCFTVNKVEFAEPLPDQLMYEGGFGLPIHYASVLEPLSSLEHVSINIPAFATSLIQLDKENMWSGECESCNGLLQADLCFANKYASRKQQAITRLADGTERRWRRPPSLRCVEWIFFPATADNGYNPLSFNDEVLETVDTGSELSDAESGEGTTN